MKKLLITLLCLVPTLAFGGTKNLELVWDNNTETDLAGYIIYFMDDATSQTLLVLDVPYRSTDTDPIIENRVIDVPDDEITVIAIEHLAYDDAGNQSIRSDRVTAEIDLRPPPDTTPPAKPATITITVSDAP